MSIARGRVPLHRPLYSPGISQGSSRYMQSLERLYKWCSLGGPHDQEVAFLSTELVLSIGVALYQAR